MSQAVLKALRDDGDQRINNTLKKLRAVKERFLITYGFKKSGNNRRMKAVFTTSTVNLTLMSTKSLFLPAKLKT